ncbi:MAG: hypothetical protein ACE5J2_07530 [Nitrososphaerales archaeon]
MEKIYLGIMVFAAVGIAYTFLTSSPTQAGEGQSTILISVEKSTVNYNDMEGWSAKGLPPNEDYKATLRSIDTALLLGSGTADANGEATGSFLVGENIPPGTFTFRVELASDPKKFDEVSVDLVPEGSRELVPDTILLSVEKTTVDYNDMEAWSVKGLPPNTDYITSLRFSDTVLIVGSGTADANGEATGSFLVGENIPPGTFTFRVELASDPKKFDEVSVDLVP